MTLFLHVQVQPSSLTTSTSDDNSAIEMAAVAVNGGFQKLKDLSFSINHKVTEEGYRNLF